MSASQVHDEMVITQLYYKKNPKDTVLNFLQESKELSIQRRIRNVCIKHYTLTQKNYQELMEFKTLSGLSSSSKGGHQQNNGPTSHIHLFFGGGVVCLQSPRACTAPSLWSSCMHLWLFSSWLFPWPGWLKCWRQSASSNLPMPGPPSGTSTTSSWWTRAASWVFCGFCTHTAPGWCLDAAAGTACSSTGTCWPCCFWGRCYTSCSPPRLSASRHSLARCCTLPGSWCCPFSKFCRPTRTDENMIHAHVCLTWKKPKTFKGLHYVNFTLLVLLVPFKESLSLKPRESKLISSSSPTLFWKLC